MELARETMAEVIPSAFQGSVEVHPSKCLDCRGTSMCAYAARVGLSVVWLNFPEYQKSIFTTLKTAAIGLQFLFTYSLTSGPHPLLKIGGGG